MREAVHIFLKDSRQFRVPIAILLGWTALFAIAGARPASGFPDLQLWPALLERNMATAANFVFPLAWGYLISQVVHADALPGDRQFWVTRPYHRLSLIGAKALFVLAYVMLPLAVAQASNTMMHGLPLAPYLPGLVWEQVLIASIVVLPIATVAALTSTLVQFVMVGLIVPLLFFAHEFLYPWAGIAWIRDGLGIGVVLAVGSTVLWLQYARRRTTVSRLVALTGVLVALAAVALLPWSTAFALQSRLAGVSAGTVTVDLPRRDRQAARTLIEVGPGQRRYLVLPFRVVGPSADAMIACEASEVTIESPDGQTWTSGLRLVGAGRMITTPRGVRQPWDPCQVTLVPPLEFFDHVADRAVRIHAVLYVTLFGAEQSATVPAGQGLVGVNRSESCSALKYFPPRSDAVPKIDDDGFTRVSCLTAFRSPGHLLLTQAQPWAGSLSVFPVQALSYSPFPADLRIVPVESSSGSPVRPAVDAVVVRTLTPVSHVRVPVESSDVRLADFEL